MTGRFSNSFSVRYALLALVFTAALVASARAQARPTPPDPTAPRDMRSAQRAAPARPVARPAPLRPTVLSVGGSVVWLTPPTHPGAQPVVAVLDDRCSNVECEPDGAMSGPFGWGVCVRDLQACGGGQPSDAGVVLDTVLRAIAADHPGTLAPAGGVLVLRGARSVDLGSVLRALPGRWSNLLLLGPTAAPNHADAATFTRVGLFASRCPLAGDVAYRWAIGSQWHGAQTAWFLDEGGRTSRRATVRDAIQWLFVGGDPADSRRPTQCVPPVTPSTVARAQ